MMNPRAQEVLIDYERETRARISIELARLQLAFRVSLDRELTLKKEPLDAPIPMLSIIDEPVMTNNDDGGFSL